MNISKVNFGDIEITNATGYQLYLILDGKAESTGAICESIEECEAKIAFATLIANGLGEVMFGKDYGVKPKGFIMEVNFHQVTEKGVILEEKIISKFTKNLEDERETEKEKE